MFLRSTTQKEKVFNSFALSFSSAPLSHVDPTLLNDFEMATDGNGDPPVPNLRTMKELCQPTLNGWGGPISPIHLDKFLHVTQSIKVNGVTDDALHLYLFPHSLKHHATAWFDRLTRNYINTLEQMAKMFLGKYFPPSRVTKLRNAITNFRQRLDESLFKAWECYKLSIDRLLGIKCSKAFPLLVMMISLLVHFATESLLGHILYMTPWPIKGVLRKNTENLNTKISKLNEELSNCETDLYNYTRGLSQVEARLVEFKEHEVEYCERIRVLERDVGIRDNKIEYLKNELEQIKKEKESLNNKLTSFENASKDLDNLLGSQRSDKNKEGLGYSDVPPPPT
nr:hypothetical protein [Tanacetum cinerariifolium]